MTLSVGQHGISTERFGVESSGSVSQQTQQLVVRTHLTQLYKTTAMSVLAQSELLPPPAEDRASRL